MGSACPDAREEDPSGHFSSSWPPCHPVQGCNSTRIKLKMRSPVISLLLCLLLPNLLLAKTCCDEPQSGCFPARCEEDCSYKPCQHAPCNGDSIGQMWCVNKQGERITDIGWSTCGSRFATFKDCKSIVEAWEAAAQNARTG